MGRGRYPARLKVEPPPPALAERYLQVWPGHLLYHSREQFPQLTSPALFGNQLPLELDLGCATGDLLLALATHRPEANYVGVDIVAKPLWRAVERAAAADLPNLKFVQADARLVYHQIPAGALRRAYVHFPAPLLRNRQRNQRLIGPLLLEQMQRCLEPGGILSFMTDEPALEAELLKLLPLAPRLQRLPAVPTDPLEALLKSHYQRRWEARGRPIMRVLLVREAD